MCGGEGRARVGVHVRSQTRRDGRNNFKREAQFVCYSCLFLIYLFPPPLVAKIIQKRSRYLRVRKVAFSVITCFSRLRDDSTSNCCFPQPLYRRASFSRYNKNLRSDARSRLLTGQRRLEKNENEGRKNKMGIKANASNERLVVMETQ